MARQDGRAAWRAVNAHVDGTTDVLSSVLALDAKIGLVDDMLHYFDRASMAHSLEVRVPFLDHEFVQLCSTIPSSLKVRDGVTKYLLKRAARGLVPDRLVDKPKVGFFNAEVGRWLSTNVGKDASDVLLDTGARYPNIVDRRAVTDLLTRYRDDPRSGDGHALLTVLMLELWLSTVLPRARQQSRVMVGAASGSARGLTQKHGPR